MAGELENLAARLGHTQHTLAFTSLTLAEQFSSSLRS